MSSTILITGGAGYVGSHVSCLLAQNGYSVIVLDSFKHKQQVDLPWATIINMDFSDQALLATIFKRYNISAVIHCAASIEVGISVKKPLQFYENNVAKTIMLLDSMVQHNVLNFIFSSSCAVYGEPQFLPIPEDHPKNPTNPYGRSKLIIEDVLYDAQRAYGLNYAALRYFNVAGAWPEFGLYEQHDPETHLIPLLIRAAQYRNNFVVYGNNYPTYDGTAVRDYIHVRDVAQAHLQALTFILKNNFGVFNIGSGLGTSVQEMIQAIKLFSGLIVNAQFKERRAGDVAALIADISYARQLLQWVPQYSALSTILSSIMYHPANVQCKEAGNRL